MMDEANKPDTNQKQGGQVQPFVMPCPCGETPERVYSLKGDTSKYAYAAGSCCGEWHIEFRTNYTEAGSAECDALALEAWNAAKRAA